MTAKLNEMVQYIKHYLNLLLYFDLLLLLIYICT